MNQLGTTNSLRSNTFTFSKEYRIDNSYAPKRYMIYEARKIYEIIFPRTKLHQREISSSFYLDQDIENFPLKIGEYYLVPPLTIQDIDNLTNQTIAEILKEGEKNFAKKYKNKFNDGSLTNVDSKEIKKRLNYHIKNKTEAEELKRDFQILMEEDIRQFESKCNCFPAKDHSYFTGKKSLWKLMRKKIKGSYTFTVNLILSQFAYIILKFSDKFYKHFLSSVNDIGFSIEKISFLMLKQAKYLEKLNKSNATVKTLEMDEDFKNYCSCCIEDNEENIGLKNILVKTFAKFLKVNQPYELANTNTTEDLNNLIKKLREYRHFIKVALPRRAKVLETLENIMISELKNVENHPIQNCKGVKEENPLFDNRYARNFSKVEYKDMSTEKRKRSTLPQDHVKFPHDAASIIHKDLKRTQSTVTWKGNLEIDDHEYEQQDSIWSGQSIEIFDRDKSLTSIISADDTQHGTRKSRLFSVTDSLEVLDERKFKQYKDSEPDIKSTLRPSIKKTKDSLTLIRKSIQGSVSFKNIYEHQPKLSVPESVAESAFSGRDVTEIDNSLKLKPDDSLLLFCKFINNIIPKDKSNVLKTSSGELEIQGSLKSILKSSTDFPSMTSSTAAKRVRISHAEVLDPKPVVNFDVETEIIIPPTEMDVPTSTESGQNYIKNETFCHVVGEKNRTEYLQSFNEFLIRRIDSLAKLMKKFPWLNECYYKDQNFSERKPICDLLYFNNNFYI